MNNDAKQKLHDIFNAYKHTSDYKDRVMIDIMANKEKFEQNLDDMWDIYTRGNMMQVFEYRKAVDQIKNAGLRVQRNSSGKHRIVCK